MSKPENNVFPLRPQHAPPLMRSIYPPEVEDALRKAGFTPPNPNTIVNHPDLPPPASLGADLSEPKRTLFREATCGPIENRSHKHTTLVTVMGMREHAAASPEPSARPLSADAPNPKHSLGDEGLDIDTLTPEEIEKHDRTAAEAKARKEQAKCTSGKTSTTKPPKEKPQIDIAAIGDAVDRLNRSFAYIEARPDAVMQLDWRHPTDGVTRMLRIKDFYLLLANDRVEIIPGQPKVEASRLWFTSERRNQWRDAGYFGPGQPVPDRFMNLYHGMKITPKKGVWSKLKAFLQNIICAGNLAAYDYLLNLMQWKVQNPTKPTEVSIVLLGKVGVGKGTFAYIFSLIFGEEHFVHFTDSVQAQNKFNNLLLGRFVAFYDETFYGHDPRIKQKLKGYVTERTITIEPKFINAFQTLNILLNIFASNEMAAAPIDANDRRAFVLAVSEDRQEDLPYFADLKKAFADGEVAAFVYDALRADLSDFERTRRTPLPTKAKATLALVTGNEVQTFLYGG
jgi:hypothetical protein